MFKNKKRLNKILVLFLIILLALALASYMYINDYYRASEYVDDIIINSGNTIESKGHLTKITDNNLQAELLDESIGIIFYPGGKVESKAYMPLMIKLSNLGISAVLVEMPANLAVFDIDAADDVYSKYPEVDKWYIAGHSLGGAMASSYVEDNYKKVEGLILLGAYPINDAPLDTLLIYGSYDLMLDLEKTLKADEIYEIIDGNHSYFGDYGEQEGDGTAGIRREDQQNQTVERIKKFITKDSN